jgi:hypothetical protein
MMFNRAGRWLVDHWPAARAVRQGMLDGQAGLLPQDISGYYYLGGYRIGRAKRVEAKQAKP